jgi:hypothetical protein
MDSWQVEGKRCSVGHGGCGAQLIRDATRLNTDLLRESLLFTTAAAEFFILDA